MTLRSVILGLLGAAAICGVAYLNDNILRQTLIVGNNMPISVYGPLILFVLLLNPLLRMGGRSFALRARELAVIMTLTLAACCIPESGLLRTFTTSLVMPHHFNRIEPGWKDYDAIAMTPEQMLADVTDEDMVLDSFIRGMGEGGKHISWSDVPWHGWTRTLLYWLPLILSLWIAMLGLSLVVHKQWSDHELLPYPVAEFANRLLPEEGEAGNRLLKSPLFWIPVVVVFGIHFNNFLTLFFPDTMIRVPVQFDFTPLSDFVPYLRQGGGRRLLAPVMYFCVIGFAYFIPRDVSFSIGIGPFFWAIVAGLFATYGISLRGTISGGSWYIGLKGQTFVLFGANLGVFLAVLYTGRHYYTSLLRRACGGRGTDKHEAWAVWGARVFILFTLAFIVQLTITGLDWQLAVLYTGILIIFHVVMSRVLAETGLFYMQPYFFPCVVIWGVLGSQALGPSALIIMFMLTTVLLIDPRESLMPFMVNSLKLLDLREEKLGRTSGLSVAAIVLGLAIALPLCLYFQYDRGYARSDTWAGDAVPKMTYQNVVPIKQKLMAQDRLEQSESLHGWERFSEMSPNWFCVGCLGAGLVLVLLFTSLRLRFTWWPLHPVLFLTWATEPVWRFCGAFLVGCFVKAMVTKYGSMHWYQKLKPIMYGLIAGEIVGAVLPSLVGAVYYIVTGDPPKTFHVLPG